MPSLAAEIHAKPEDIIADAYSRFPTDRISISFSGAEDVVLIDLAVKLAGSDIRIFTLDTGRLHEETYQFIERVRTHYGVAIDIMAPDQLELDQFVHEKGLFSFYQDGHTECCGTRKIATLQRALAQLDAWITGQRRDQGTTRTNVPYEQVDSAFSTSNHEILKFNPLAMWQAADVWSYIRDNEVPYNTLHDQGFKSIGCAPCTRPIEPHESERAGRWWWENEEDKECGLHSQNLSVSE